MDAICPSVINSLVQIWTTLHEDLELEISPAEARYLHDVVLGLDDELVARLLGVKLAMARRRVEGGDRTAVARGGSEVLYAVQGQRRCAKLVHGGADASGRLGVGTRFGAALLGMRQGKSILWPLEHGRLVEVQILEVTAPPAGGRWTSLCQPGLGVPPCVSG